MFKFTRYLAMLATALLLVGCGGPAKLDTSSDSALRASIDHMLAGKSAADGKAFAEECMLAAAFKPNGEIDEEVLKKSLGAMTGQPVSPAEMLKPLNGLTMEEIKARAAEVKKKQAAAKSP